jgi:hypothetical protein
MRIPRDTPGRSDTGSPGGRSRPPIRGGLHGLTRDVGRSAGRSTVQPNRGRIDRTPARSPARPFARRFRRGWCGRGLRDVAPIELTGGQDGGSIPGRPADDGGSIRGVVGDRVASDQRDARGGGIIGPEPTVIVATAPPLAPVVPVAARLGTPVMLPGWILDIPPEPS